MPDVAQFGVLMDPAPRGGQALIAGLQASARTLGVRLVVVYAGTNSDLETAFATFSQQRVGAVMNGSTSTFYTLHVKHLAELAARYKLPAIYLFREFAVAGGLMSYGSSRSYAFHQAGTLQRAIEKRR
jgi:putative ABC transport system substrate-binding protein